MKESDILRMIRQAVRQELAPILLGLVTETADANRATVQRFQTDQPLANVRNVQPYGLASRAPRGTPGLLIPLGADPTNQTLVGHFDEGRPNVAEGEVCLYGPAGQMIWFKADGSIYQGAGGDASEPIVLGTILAAAVKTIVQALTESATIGVDSLGGPVQLSPDVKEKLAQALQKYVDDPSTNFLSQKNFVERE